MPPTGSSCTKAQPIDQPQVVDLRFEPARGIHFSGLAPAIEDIVRRHLASLRHLADDLIDGRLAFDRWPLRTASMRST